jgi:hypothetical protein
MSRLIPLSASQIALLYYGNIPTTSCTSAETLFCLVQVLDADNLADGSVHCMRTGAESSHIHQPKDVDRLSNVFLNCSLNAFFARSSACSGGIVVPGTLIGSSSTILSLSESGSASSIPLVSSTLISCVGRGGAGEVPLEP